MDNNRFSIIDTIYTIIGELQHDINILIDHLHKIINEKENKLLDNDSFKLYTIYANKYNKQIPNFYPSLVRGDDMINNLQDLKDKLQQSVNDLSNIKTIFGE